MIGELGDFLMEGFDQRLALFRQVIVRSDLQEARYEILLRVRNDAEFRSPEGLLNGLDQHRLTSALDLWVFRQITEYLAASGDNCTYSININPNSFCDPSADRLIRAIWEEVKAQRFAINRLEIELLEGHTIEWIQLGSEALSLLKLLKTEGVSIAFDDFGKGRHSFEDMLVTVRPSCLKIDQAFVINAVGDSRHRTFLQHIVAITKSYGIEAVAEGVEDKVVFDMVRSIGFDWYQGYWLGMPEYFLPLI